MSNVNFLETLKTKERHEILEMYTEFDKGAELKAAEALSSEDLISNVVDFKKSLIAHVYLAQNLDATCTHILDQIVDENEWIRDSLAGIVDSISRRDEREPFDLDSLEKGLVRIMDEMSLQDIVDEIRSE